MTLSQGPFVLNQIGELFEMPPGKAGMLMESCVWCMEQFNHNSGVKIEVLFNGEKNSFPVIWEINNSELIKVRNQYNYDDAVEFGAEALAFFISCSQTKYNRVKRTVTKTGIDYWLGFRDDDPEKPFQKAGRLEISGIMRESATNKVDYRIKSKFKQTELSVRTLLPVFVVVVVFEKPSAKMAEQNGNC